MDYTYLNDQDALGLKVGDEVTVYRKIENRYKGWQNSWSPTMDAAINNTYTITNIKYARGVELNFGTGNLLFPCYSFIHPDKYEPVVMNLLKGSIYSFKTTNTTLEFIKDFNKHIN